MRDGKPRIVTIKILLHGGYKLHKVWKMEDLSRIDGDSGREKRYYFTLLIDRYAHRFSTDSITRRDAFLWALISMSRNLLHVTPQVRMVDLTRLEGAPRLVSLRRSLRCL